MILDNFIEREGHPVNNRGTNPFNLAFAWIDLRILGQDFPFQEKKVIINRINGSIDFGSLNALMGPSGAGKSTLLRCINGQNTAEVDKSSNIYLGAHRKIRSCFIVQDVSEHLTHGLTAMQSLIYASKLKNCNEKLKCDHKSIARNLLSELMILDTENTLVERCSGGEQKRIVIAMELTSIKKPNLMCIDEPTSGLDSNAAEIVIQCFKDVSRKHDIGIVTSIHQPNRNVLMLFDKLYVLGKGGFCVYEGPPQHLRQHLHRADIICDDEDIPIEVLLKTASVYGKSVERLSQLSLENKNVLKKKCQTKGVLSPNGINHRSPRFNIFHCWYLILRTSIYTLRSQWMSLLTRSFSILMYGFILTRLYNKHCGEANGCIIFEEISNTSCFEEEEETLKEESFITQNVSLQFMSFLGFQFLLIVSTVLIFTSEVKVFYNEHQNGWYSTGSYYWAKTVVELPLLFGEIAIFSLIVYYSNNQIKEADRFFGYMAITGLGAICTQGMAIFVGIISNSNESIAVVLGVALYLVNNMFVGFLSPLKELTQFIHDITHISFTKQCFEMYLYILYGFDRCPQNEGYVNTVLEKYDLLDEDDFWVNSGILSAHIINYRLLALFVLLFKANPIRLDFLKRNKNKENIQNINNIITQIESLESIDELNITQTVTHL